jgi:hypothetical protein
MVLVPADPPSERRPIEMPERYFERKVTREAMEEGCEVEEEWEDCGEPQVEQVRDLLTCLRNGFASGNLTAGVLISFPLACITSFLFLIRRSCHGHQQVVRTRTGRPSWHTCRRQRAFEHLRAETL